MTLIIGTIFLQETKDVDITTVASRTEANPAGGPRGHAGFFAPVRALS